MIVLAFLLSAVANFGPAVLLAMQRNGLQLTPDTLVGIGVVFLLGICLHGVVFGPILWLAHRRKLTRYGRRWFALAGLATGILEGLAIVAATASAAGSARAAMPYLLFGGLFGSMFGIPTGLVFGLTATRRAALEAVFE
ncbi:MAG: hypothetical protein JWM33_2197 [Caulobacteraceae bacterium]|nr:hypothetical protein [Caulobacteraceae bacterium]